MFSQIPQSLNFFFLVGDAGDRQFPIKIILFRIPRRKSLKNLLTKDVETLIDPVRYAAGEPILAAISSQYEIPVEESTALSVLAQKKGMFS